ncbi:MAG: 50S ribosomal protein L15, partial [Lachnospiraceae bacterium]|nr:50S ribosomal protein L15 [Lachnospiraceae bacterium]
NRNSKEIVAINLRDLERVFADGDTVDTNALLEKGVIKHVYDGVKVLGNGEYTKKLTVRLHAFSASAKEKIEACGGTVEVI